MNQRINVKQLAGLTLVLGLFFVLFGCLKKVEVKSVVVEKKQDVEIEEEKDEIVEKTEEVKQDEIDTSDWLTYRNEELGVEFKYPKKYKEFITHNIEFSKDDKINSGKSLLIYSEVGGISFRFYSKDYSSYTDEFIYHGDKNLSSWCKKNLQVDNNYQSVVYSNSVGFCDNIKIDKQDTFYDMQMTYLPECGLEVTQSAYLNLKNSNYSGLVITSPLKIKLEHISDYNPNCSRNNQLDKEVKQNFEKIVNKEQLDDITKQDIAEFQFIVSTFKISDWLTYRNEELGVEFKYPETWKIVEEKISGNLKNFLNLSFDTGYKIIKNQKPLIATIEATKFINPISDDFNFTEETEFNYNLKNGAKAIMPGCGGSWDCWNLKFIDNSYYGFSFDLNIPSGIGDNPEPINLYTNNDTIFKIKNFFRLIIKNLEQIK